MSIIELLDYRHGAKLPTRMRIKETQVRGLMRITSEIVNCSVYLGYAHGAGDKFMGTAFGIAVPMEGLPDRDNLVLVTAKHCIEKIPENIDTVRLRFNPHGGESQWVPTKRTDWIHSHETDISIYIWIEERDGKVEDYYFYSIDESMHATKERIEEHSIGIGDEVITVGLFTLLHGRRRNHPIIRVGNIAALPEDKITTELYGDIEAYLVELRSIGGLSGSPVFVNLGGPLAPPPLRRRKIEQKGDTITDRLVSERIQIRYPGLIEDTIYLLGVMHGHFPIEKDAIIDTPQEESEKLNTGIGVVVPIDYVWDLLKTERSITILKGEENKERTRIAPVMDSSGGISKEQFEDTLRKVSKTRSSQPEKGKKRT